MALETNDRSLGQMFADLSRDTRLLIQQEIELAKKELTEAASRMVKGVALIVSGGVLAHGALLALVATLVLALIEFGIPAWLAALLGSVVAAGAGYLLIRAGRAALRAETLKPRQTLETLKEDAQWLKSQTR
jgi:hypothetical protein